MTHRIVITSQKGGVGKTTVALHLAVALADRGRSVLLADLDPQGGIGLSLARGDTELEGMADCLMGHVSADDSLLETKVPGLTLLPRGRLDPIDVCEFERALFTPGVLDTLFRQVEARFEIVILDTPSGLGMIPRGALRAADSVLLPFQAAALSLRSISQALRVVEHVRSTENPKLSLLGILPTMAERDQDPSQECLIQLWTGFAGVFDAVIPRSDAFAHASREGLPLGFFGGGKSTEARRFDALAMEVEAALEALSSTKEAPHDTRQNRAFF